VPSCGGAAALPITDRYPELSHLPDGLVGADVVVDGEVVALDRLGRPDFGLLQNRMHRTGGAEVARLAGAAPVTYLVFDVLTVAGRSLLDLPYDVRRERLDGLGAVGRRWVPTPWFRGGGADVHAASRANGLEGVVASGWTRPTGRACAPRSGARSSTCGCRASSSAGGGRAGAGGPGEWARCWSASTTTTAGWSTPGTWAPASPTPSSASSRPCSSPPHLSLRRHPAARRRPRRRLGRTRAGGRGGLRGLDRRRPDAPPGVAGAAGDLDVDDVVVEWSPRPGAMGWAGEPPAVRVEGRQLTVSNLEKVLFPEVSFTKAHVIDYYVRIAPVLLPHLSGGRSPSPAGPTASRGRRSTRRTAPGTRRTGCAR
jgi:bifunctional non-homologous end joining protein LigD